MSLSSPDISDQTVDEPIKDGLCVMVDDILEWMLLGVPVDTGFPESRQSLYHAWSDYESIRASFCSRLTDIFRLSMLPDMDKHPDAARLAMFCIAAWQIDHLVPDLLDILNENHKRRVKLAESGNNSFVGTTYEKRVFIPLDTLFAELEVPTEAFNLSRWIERLHQSTPRQSPDATPSL